MTKVNSIRDTSSVQNYKSQCVAFMSNVEFYNYLTIRVKRLNCTLPSRIPSFGYTLTRAAYYRELNRKNNSNQCYIINMIHYQVYPNQFTYTFYCWIESPDRGHPIVGSIIHCHTQAFYALCALSHNNCNANHRI